MLIDKGNVPQNILERIKARSPRTPGVRISIARLRKLNGRTEEGLLKTLCAEHEIIPEVALQ